ncbi:PREDICTED: uncharacterized protein LOC109484909 [Branchiostoma belcheri]|uniref:Uncharacterized protein LOC109484909 n=1 Tax=Branchiostoma belcheri TaxID=7741 RepID=A0A6P5A353_BRABE|nr:PREDICTED: uncharacterized protein LOC109484909 [Branchiostoma belcheri]
MTSSDISRAAGKFRDIDAKLQSSGRDLEDLSRVQKDYVRELENAMAEMDALIEAEALKSLGDVFLEKGRTSGDLAEFGKAQSVYSAALVRCTHIGQVQTLLHRVKYARTFTDRCNSTVKLPPNQNGDRNKLDSKVNREQEQLSHLKIAERVQTRVAGLTEESLEASYVHLLVESVTASDLLAEVEALKGLGDEYLRRGGVSRDTADFTRASTLYSAGLARCQDADNKVALQHRVRYSARLRTEEIKGTHKRYERKTIEVQYVDKHPSDNIDSEDEEDSGQSEPNEQSAESTYGDQYEAGASALRDGDLESAEQNLASALRLVHGNPEEMTKEASCLCRLGDVHVSKGKSTGDGKFFSQAAALYNGALVRAADATFKVELTEKLKETEVSFLKHVVHTNCMPSLSDVERAHKEVIRTMREKVKQRLDSIDQQFNLREHLEDQHTRTRVESQRADAIRGLFVEIAQSRKEFVGVLASECMEVLGPAPCKYAVTGLGSQATETVTPYSDLEFTILLDEHCDTDSNKQYFRHLTHYLHLKIINLGETIIPAVAIKSLNDFESSNPADNWFYDSVTPRGFAFDGAMPWASKTPLGRGKTKAKPALELIRSPSRMAELQQEDFALSEGYHLSDILRNVCCITGDDSLVGRYIEIVNETLTSTRRRGSSIFRRAGDTLAKDVERYGKQGLTARLLDVKKDIYRFPTISIDSLCILCGLQPGRVWKVISDMVESGILTRENADHLKVLVSISAELRLRTYLANGKQCETMSALPSIATDGQTGDREVAFKSVFYLPDDDMLFRYHYRAIPLKKLLSSVSTDHLPESLRRLRSTTLFDAGPNVKARICMLLLKAEEAIGHYEHAVLQLLNIVEPLKQLDALDYLDERCISDESLATLLRKIGTAWKVLGNSRKAISYYQMTLRIVKAVHGRDSCNPEIASAFGYLGSAWLKLDKKKEALGYLTIAHKMREEMYGPDASHPEIESSLDSLAEAWQYQGDFRKAMSVFEQKLRLTKMLHKGDELALATCLKSMGGCLSNLGDSRKAIRYQEKALKMIRSVYGHNTGHPMVISALKGLGESYLEVSNHRRGVDYMEQALRAWKIIYGERADHPDIASALSDLGLAWNSAGDFTVSQKYHVSALKMRRDIYGVGSPHSDIAYSLKNIGFTLTKRGNHKEALQYQEQALAMLKRVHGENVDHPDIANTLNHLGECCCNVGDYERATQIFQEALAMWNACHGDISNHPDIAMAFNNLGIVSRHIGDHRKAISYHRQALEIAEATFGRETPHSLIASTYNNMATAYVLMGDPTRAIEYNENALSIWKAIYGSGSPYVLQTLMNLAVTLNMFGRKKEAMKHYQEALKMCEDVYGRGKDHPNVATLLSNLGLLWSELFQYDKALDFLERSLEMKQRLFGDMAHPTVATTSEIIAGVWLKRRDHANAVKYFEETLEMLKIVHGDRPQMRVAEILVKLGICWEILNDYKTAIHCNERALDMLNLICEDPTHPDIVSTQNSLQRLRKLKDSKT